MASALVHPDLRVLTVTSAGERGSSLAAVDGLRGPVSAVFERGSRRTPQCQEVGLSDHESYMSA
jgi:hypothetical protein